MVDSWRGELQNNSLVLIPPGIPHVFRGRTGGCRAQVLMLSEEYLHSGDAASAEALSLLRFWREHVREHGFLTALPPAGAMQAGAIMRKIGEIQNCPAFGNALRVRNLIFQLLMLAFSLPSPPRYRPDAEAPIHKNTIEALLYYLDAHFSRKITVAEALKITGMSRSAFHPCFSRTTGMSFCRYVNHLRLAAVERMIRNGAPIDAAAKQCGFSSRSNYYQQRKNKRSELPLAVRREAK